MVRASNTDASGDACEFVSDTLTASLRKGDKISPASLMRFSKLRRFTLLSFANCANCIENTNETKLSMSNYLNTCTSFAGARSVCLGHS
jgi:hypothetical protein